MAPPTLEKLKKIRPRKKKVVQLTLIKSVLWDPKFKRITNGAELERNRRHFRHFRRARASKEKLPLFVRAESAGEGRRIRQLRSQVKVEHVRREENIFRLKENSKFGGI